MILQVRHVIQYANNNVVPGALIQQYSEANSGRLYGEGVHLQNVMKGVRNAALSGMYDYDIENCHFALLDQMADKAGYESSTIRYYLKNKQQIRETIEKDVGITIKQAKTCLLAMVYGAKNSGRYGDAIPREIGLEKAKKLYTHSMYKGLQNDVKQARKAIISDARQHRGNYINEMGKGISAKKKAPKVLAHLLQGMEAKILNVVGEMHSDNIVLLQHDGWVTKEPIDKEMTVNRISEVTGMKVELSEDVIGQKPMDLGAKMVS